MHLNSKEGNAIKIAVFFSVCLGIVNMISNYYTISNYHFHDGFPYLTPYGSFSLKKKTSCEK